VGVYALVGLLGFPAVGQGFINRTVIWIFCTAACLVVWVVPGRETWRKPLAWSLLACGGGYGAYSLGVAVVEIFRQASLLPPL
jgi:hypothetical protein